MRKIPKQQAEPVIPCVDIWQEERMTRDVCEAYKALAGRGEINIVKIRVNKKDGIVTVEYLSTLPPEWTRDALKKEKEKKAQHDLGNDEA